MVPRNKDIISKTMKAVKSKGSHIETMLSKALWSKGIRFRKNVTDVFGKPDICIKRLKIAIFVDSEFWHGKNWQKNKFDHKTNIEYWHKKIERNIQRDAEVNEWLINNGWAVLRFWGEDIKNDINNCVSIIREKINVRKQSKGY